MKEEGNEIDIRISGVLPIVHSPRGARRRLDAPLAFHESKYKIWEDDSRSIIGTDGIRKVQIVTVNPREIRIQWAPGFGDKEKHLYKVAQAMLWALTTESKPGEVTINWCKDLKTEEFRRVALEALHGRGAHFLAG